MPDLHRALHSGDVPTAGPGQLLCRTLAVTIGAGQRAGLQGSASYAGAPEVGRVMNGTGFARVEASNDPSIPVGAHVTGPTGWRTRCRPANSGGTAIVRVGPVTC